MPTSTARFALALLFILCTSTSSFARREEDLELLARVADGPSVAVAALGDLVALGHGGYLELLDYAEPAAPQLLVRQVLPGFVTQIALTETLALVHLEDRGLQVLDITQPQAPVWLAEIPTTAACRGLRAKGTLLYLCLDDALCIYDLGQAAAPEFLGSWAQANLTCFDLWGHHAYLGFQPGYLAIVDVADPAAPFLAQVLPPEGGLPFYTSLACASGLLHGIKRDISGFHSFRSFDLSDPVQPAQLCLLTGDLDLRAVAVDGDRLHFITGSSLEVYDDTDPSTPQWVAAAALLERPFALALAAGRSYLAEYYFGLQAFALEPGPRGAALVELGRFSEGQHGAVTDVARQGNLLVVAAQAPALSVYDVADPEAPALLGRLYEHAPGAADTAAYEVTLHAGHAYLRGSDSGGSWLRVVDLGDPAAPAVVSELPAAMFVQFRGDIGYGVVNGGVNQLVVYDLADPASPQPLGVYPQSAWSNLLVKGDRLLVATGSQLAVYDITDPGQLQGLGTADLAWGGTANAIVSASAAGLAFFAARMSGGPDALRIVDDTDPSLPAVHVGPALAAEPWDLLAADDYLYIAGGQLGVELLDLALPLAPVSLGCSSTGYWAWGVGGDGLCLAVADSHDGFYLLRNALVLTGAEEVPPAGGLALSAQPNPFNPATELRFSAPAGRPLRLSIHDLAGRRVDTLFAGPATGGEQRLVWAGRDAAGRALPTGVYLARLEAGTANAAIKLLLIK